MNVPTFVQDRKRTYEKVCKNKDFCEVLMPSKKDNVLKS